MSETVEIDFSKPVPGDVKVYVVQFGGISLWTPALDDAVSEMENAAENDELPFDRDAVTAALEALTPGADLFEMGSWTVEVQMVDQNWLDSLPEHDGW